MDEPGAGNPSLSSGERRGACCFVLFAGREDLLYGGSGCSTAALCLSVVSIPQSRIEQDLG